jgi:hypothetical protein
MKSSRTFRCSTHYMCMCRWGRRFRLPTPYVLSQKASALAPGYLRGNLSFCDLATSGVHAEESANATVGRRKRLPHTHPRPVVCGFRPRDGQSGFRACLVARFQGGTCGGRRAPVWREWKAFLSAPSLGDHAQSLARIAAAQYSTACDYALVERLYRSTSQSTSRPYGTGLLAR